MSLQADDIRQAGSLIVAAYGDGATASASITAAGLTGWNWVDPTALHIASNFVHSKGFFSASFFNAGLVIDVHVLFAYNATSHTLAVAFRGSNSSTDLVNDVLSDFGIIDSHIE